MEHDTPMLFPLPEDEFWRKIRILLREELERIQESTSKPATFEVNGMVKKPLYKMAEVCEYLQISRQTAHSWIKLGILKGYKIRSRLFFLASDVEKLLYPKSTDHIT